MAIWMRWGALLGIVACGVAPRVLPPVQHATPASSVGPLPTPPFPEYQLRAAALAEYVFEGRADRLLLGDTRLTLRDGAIDELSPTTLPSMQAGREVPAAAGGGFVFWDSTNLYRTRSFVGELEPLVATHYEVSRVAFGPGYWLLVSPEGRRLAIEPTTGAAITASPQGVVDVAMDEAGRVIAALELGRAALSLDGGRTYRQLEDELGGHVTELWREPLGFVVDDRTLVSVAADGTLQRGTAPPRTQPPTGLGRGESPSLESTWPPLERAFGSGIAAGSGEALVVDSSSVSRVDLRSGKVVLTGPQVLPAPARCRLVGDGHEPLLACQALGALHIFSSPLQSPPRLEKRFSGEARVWEGFGRVLVDRDCDGSSRPWSVCQRGTDGEWRGLTSQHGPAEVARYVPKADGGALALLEPNSAFDLASGKQVSLNQSGFARAASSEGCVVDAKERLRCLTSAGVVVLEPDGKLSEQPRFDDAFGSGQRALAIRDDHFFQTTDYGETWTEVRAPPAFGHSGSRGSTCSPLGCVFGAWIRRGWEIHPPRVPMRRWLPSFWPSSPPVELRELSCRARAAGAAKAVFERAEHEKVAWGARLVSQSLLLKGLRIPAAPQGAAASGDSDQRGELAIAQGSLAGHARAEFRYVDFLDPRGQRHIAPLPYAGLERERERLGIGSPFEIPGDENSLTGVPVLVAADGSADGFILIEQAVTLWIHGARVEVVPLGGEYEDWSVESAISTKDGLVLLVTQSTDGRARVLRAQSGALSELFEVPATPLRPRHPTADALGVSAQGELVVLRFTSGGDDPPSTDSPVLAYAPGKPLQALAPFRVARTADDTGCNTAGGYRTLVMPQASWLRTRATSTTQPKDWGMVLSARWSDRSVCIDALELPAEPTQHAGRELGTNVVARFGAHNVAVRRGLARGWELEQQLSCELSLR